jgi:uncharacterized OB-fold protein
MSEATPVIEGLFEQTEQGARLLGSRCSTCSTPYFPRSERCHNPNCDHSDTQDASFGPAGVLWSYSVQNYPPPPPARFDEPYVPYALGVVDLVEDGLRVVGRMDVADPAELAAGDAVELVVAALYHDEDGTAQLSWMFRPV